MELKELLSRNRETLLNRWYRAILETYPPEAVEVLARDDDRFQNPVGYNLAEAVKAMFDHLLDRSGPDEIASSLDMLVRIRSVQEFTPSGAVACIFMIKDIIRKEFRIEFDNYKLHDELLAFESSVDRLALRAFDNYMQCRENLHEVRLREAKAGSIRLIEKLNRRPGGFEATERGREK